MKNGFYKTSPLYGPRTVIRKVEVNNGNVKLNGYSFTVDDFFKVNVLV